MLGFASHSSKGYIRFLLHFRKISTALCTQQCTHMRTGPLESLPYGQISQMMYPPKVWVKMVNFENLTSVSPKIQVKYVLLIFART